MVPLDSKFPSYVQTNSPVPVKSEISAFKPWGKIKRAFRDTGFGYTFAKDSKLIHCSKTP